jgi:hypothetical protein
MAVEFLGLDQLKVYPCWTEAPIGRLLQISVKGTVEGMSGYVTILALRCDVANLSAADTPLTAAPLQDRPWVVSLEAGDELGLIASTNHIGTGPALDVTDLVEIGVKTPGARPFETAPQYRGLVFPAGEGHVVKAEIGSGMVGYIALRGPDAGKSRAQLKFPAVSPGLVAVRWKEELRGKVP